MGHVQASGLPRRAEGRWCIRMEGGGARPLPDVESGGNPTARMPKAETGHGKEGSAADNIVSDNAGGINADGTPPSSFAGSRPGAILTQPHAGAAVVLRDEFYACCFEGGADGRGGIVRHGSPRFFKIDNR